MVKPIKEAVPAETESIRKRVRRAFAMNRIESTDCDYITARLDEIDARVVVMPEAGFDRREF